MLCTNLGMLCLFNMKPKMEHRRKVIEMKWGCPYEALKCTGSKTRTGFRNMWHCYRRVFQTNQQFVTCGDSIKRLVRNSIAFIFLKGYLLFCVCFSYNSFIYVLMKQLMKEYESFLIL